MGSSDAGVRQMMAKDPLGDVVANIGFIPYQHQG